MKIPDERLKQIADNIMMMADALDKGVRLGELYERITDVPIADRASFLRQLEMAELLHKRTVRNRAKTPPVKMPRYRKDTGRKPVAWSKCLWQPPA